MDIMRPYRLAVVGGKLHISPFEVSPSQFASPFNTVMACSYALDTWYSMLVSGNLCALIEPSSSPLALSVKIFNDLTP